MDGVAEGEEHAEEEGPQDEVDDEGDEGDAGTRLVYAEPDLAPGPSTSKDGLVTPRRPTKSKLKPKVITVAESPGNTFNNKTT